MSDKIWTPAEMRKNLLLRERKRTTHAEDTDPELIQAAIFWVRGSRGNGRMPSDWYDEWQSNKNHLHCTTYMAELSDEELMVEWAIYLMSKSK